MRVFVERRGRGPPPYERLLLERSTGHRSPQKRLQAMRPMATRRAP